MGFVEKKVKKRIADNLQPSGEAFLMAVWEQKRLDPTLNPANFNFKAPDGARRCSPGEHRALNGSIGPITLEHHLLQRPAFGNIFVRNFARIPVL